ncbi:S-layer homology domain-containing protein [Alkalihalobacillus sp. TS-13]|uniref:S-layer homology domain-containing protein n=1 Tax=Alkalihalobacillus sp. TS-13 TaxID=2842455 RepID=UPI001C876340|nr:S-layer homology domain-containing protein [Alkalihalobacillus sp. TS-13]
MKKLLASIFAVTLLFSSFSIAMANGELDAYYADDLEDHWAMNIMYQLIDADIIKGYVDSDGVMTARPNKDITRAEVVALLVRSLDLTSEGKGANFSDVPTDKWFYDPIQTASALGIVNGVSQTTFAPNQDISRQELATMVVRAFEYVQSIDFTYGESVDFIDSDTFSSWAVPSIDKASAVGIIEGYNGKFYPKGTATRAETSSMLLNALNREGTNLPSDDILENVVLSNENEIYAAYQSEDYQSAYPVIDRYTLGFHNALLNASNDQLIEFVGDGYSYAFEQIGTPNTKVVGKNTRFAIVELTGLSYEITTTYNGESESVPDDTTEGNYFLRKVDGEWKIYGVNPFVYTNQAFKKQATIYSPVK